MMLSTKEAAEYLGVSEGRIRQLVNSGRLTAEKTSSGWLISKDSLEIRRKTVKRGRPKKASIDKPADIFLLMSRDHEVARLAFAHDQGRFTQISILDESRVPLALLSYRCKGGDMLRTLDKWWGSRAVPMTRPNIEGHLYDIDALDTWELPFKSMGLSLSDQYWIKPIDSSIHWKDVNFFHNLFELGPVSFGASSSWLSGVGLKSPDNTTDGMLPKRWVVGNDGRRLLLKGSRDMLNREALNEVIATRMYQRLLPSSDYVEYKLAVWQDEHVCACETFVQDTEEFIPAYYLQNLDKRPNNRSEYIHYFETCMDMGLSSSFDLLDKMIVCDSILANTDRHWGNFGVVRDVETLAYRPAPIFDSGTCLWANLPLQKLNRRQLNFETRPFNKNPQKQLELVVDTRWFDPDLLDGFVDEVHELMIEETALREDAIDTICWGLNERIGFVRNWHKNLPKPHFVNFSDVAEPIVIEWVNI